MLLVHGAWSGGWSFKGIAANLRRAGHEAYRPTLTGVGERSHLLSAEIDLDTHIRDILGVIKYEELSNIVLVGHSYGGMVITGVADAVPDKIAALVYLDAFVPENGQAAAHLTAPGRVQPGDGIGVPPPPPSAFGIAPEKWALRAALLTPQPKATLTQPIKLTGGIDRVRKRIYIYANDPQPTTFTQFYEKLKNAPGWQVYTLPCTHLVQLDMPEELTRLLLSALA